MKKLSRRRAAEHWDDQMDLAALQLQAEGLKPTEISKRLPCRSRTSWECRLAHLRKAYEASE